MADVTGRSGVIPRPDLMSQGWAVGLPYVQSCTLPGKELVTANVHVTYVREFSDKKLVMQPVGELRRWIGVPAIQS